MRHRNLSYSRHCNLTFDQPKYQIMQFLIDEKIQFIAYTKRMLLQNENRFIT